MFLNMYDDCVFVLGDASLDVHAHDSTLIMCKDRYHVHMKKGY